MNLLQTNRLSVSVSGIELIRDLNVTISNGERWGILGANGAGKTTLLHTVAGLKQEVTGTVQICERDILEYTPTERAKVMGILFQDNHDSFPVTVFEAVMAGRYPHSPFWTFSSDNDIKVVHNALHAVDMSKMAYRHVDTLSGGERRRVAVATLLAQSPKIWLLDEPANHLDMHYQIALLDLIIEKVNTVDGAVIMVMHDVNLLTRYCNHALLMVNPGNILSGSVEQVICRENLELLYKHPVKAISHGNNSVYLPG